MKIVVIGAGHGGLQAAKVLAKAGYDVTIYEKQTIENVSYDWRDDVEQKVFEELNLPLTDVHFVTQAPSLIAPFSNKPLYVDIPEATRDWNIERRDFISKLSKLAEEADAKVLFGTQVEKLIIDSDEVKGIVVNNEEIFADLVIDSSGALSKFRSSLPLKCNITRMPNNDETFKVYRAFYNSNIDVKAPTTNLKKIYLKHLGEMGISWCNYEPDGVSNILVGRIDGLNDETLNRAINDLKEDNPILGDKLLRGGIKYSIIPIRHPLSRMMCKGYVAIGDAAFMTIPLIGSGMANSLRAGQYLATAIIKNNSVDQKALWEYQVEYYKNIGADHYMVDMLKRTLLAADSYDIKYFFEAGILTDDMMKALTAGESLHMSFGEVIKKLGKILKKPKFVGKFIKGALKGVKASNIAKKIPTEYNEKKITKWQNRLEKCFK